MSPLARWLSLIVSCITVFSNLLHDEPLKWSSGYLQLPATCQWWAVILSSVFTGPKSWNYYRLPKKELIFCEVVDQIFEGGTCKVTRHTFLSRDSSDLSCDTRFGNTVVELNHHPAFESFFFPLMHLSNFSWWMNCFCVVL